MKLKNSVLSLLIVLCFVFTAAVPAFASDYVTGDIVLFGEYPQTQVTDENTLSRLNSVKYAMKKVNDYFSFDDVTLGGKRYRAVRYSAYRPEKVTETASADTTDVMTYTNGYRTDTLYWFAFEPLEWRVLDPECGLILCEKVIDSMPVNEKVYEKDGVLYADSGFSTYANDYASCSLRAFLNGDFINTVFTGKDKKLLYDTVLDNRACKKSGRRYDGKSTEDKVFLLSYNESVNKSYGFSRSPRANYTRYAWPTDYAKAMGVYVTVTPRKVCNGCAPWRLRSPGNDSGTAGCVSRDGLSFDYNEVTLTDRGVRPAACVKLDSVKNGGRNAICTHLCHQDGAAGFVWKAVNFFNRLFKINQYCNCGKAHW